ncbi:hypothetical protein PR048_031475 [Dryococelus australis]|uniref:Integrase catalytic domain-containing protein n=1 Tax=Dryococelus australis TaxID=614101 RepID=A0ABQ9G879_9NEOP|nr:hypothetical protein PR048_031475 [Dryococelus australis]
MHGIPKLVIADNVPFWSRKCLLLAQEWGFTIVTSSLCYPLSNGRVERAVQTVSRGWQLDRTCTLAVLLVTDMWYISLDIGNINESESQSYPRGTRARERFTPGDEVLVQKEGLWYPTAVVDRHTSPRSYWVRDLDGKSSGKEELVRGSSLIGDRESRDKSVSEAKSGKEGLSVQDCRSECTTRVGRVVRKPGYLSDFVE